MSQIVDTLEALVSDLNAEIAGLGALKKYSIDLERKDLTTDDDTVYVQPVAQRVEFVSRAENEREFDIQIIVIRPVVSEVALAANVEAGLDTVDSILGLFEEGGALRDKSQSGATPIRIVNEPVWDQERLQNGRRFASSVIVTYAIDT